MRFAPLILVVAIVFLFNACGYKPSSHYAKEQLNGNIYVNLIIDLQDPRNAVLIKDAMNELIVHRLGAKLVYDKNMADTVVDVKLNSVSMQVLQDSDKGFSKLYKAVVSILVKYNTKEKDSSNSFSVSGDYDFSIDDGTTITDTKRFEAIKNAANEALEEVLSRIAVSSLKTVQ